MLIPCCPTKITEQNLGRELASAHRLDRLRDIIHGAAMAPRPVGSVQAVEPKADASKTGGAR